MRGLESEDFGVLYMTGVFAGSHGPVSLHFQLTSVSVVP